MWYQFVNTCACDASSAAAGTMVNWLSNLQQLVDKAYVPAFAGKLWLNP